MKLARQLWWLLVTAIVWPLVAAEFTPTITKHKEKSVAKELFYFDDSPNILALRDHKIYMSTDKGAKWGTAKDIPKHEKLIHLQMDRFDTSRAYAFTSGSKHYFTIDKGKSWKSFELEDLEDPKFELGVPPRVILNAENPNYLLIEYYRCEDLFFSEKCEHDFYYTKDLFKSKPKKLNINGSACTFAKSSNKFKAAKPETIYCVENKLNSFHHIVESNLYRSDDFFKTKKNLSNEYSKSGRLIEVRVEQDFLIAVVQNDKFNKRSKVTLLVSKDGSNFSPADLKIDMAYGVMIFLESSPLSLFLSVAAYSRVFNQAVVSSIYASDSSGLRFEKVLDSVQSGAFEKAQTIDGVWLANVVEDSNDSNDGKDKQLLDLLTGIGMDKDSKTQISLNDGKDWDLLKVIDDDDCKIKDGCSLHLLTPAERDGSGNFVTGPTPAILLGVGNTGEKLGRDIQNMKTYVSRDGGVSWKLAIDKPCVFSFGDLGNIIVAVPYSGANGDNSDTLYYSLDQGLSWETQTLETPMYPLDLTTTIDGTGTSFLLSGAIDSTPDNPLDNEFEEVLYAVDFSKAYDGKKCDKKDFEEIYARVISDEKKPICIYGHREKFKRRKPDSQCFAATLYEDVTVYDEACQCSDHDFECGPGFKVSNKDKSRCEPNSRIISDMCASKNVKQFKLPDKVLIDGDECNMGKKSLKDFVTEHTLKCSDFTGGGDKHHSTNKKITSHKNDFEGTMREYTYFEQGEDYNGENIIVRTSDNRLFASRDGGVEFVKVPIYEQILEYFMGYVPGQIVLITDSERIFVSLDSGNTYTKYDAPTSPNPTSVAVSFHKNDTNQLIWYGSEDYLSCNRDSFNKDCKIMSYISKDGAETFHPLREDVIKCDFVSPIFNVETESDKDSMIFCEVVDKEKKQINLVSTTNDFKDEKVVAENIVGYAISGNFIVVGSVDKNKQTLTAMVTENGVNFADAAVPHDLDIDIKQAFTILDSEGGSIFMHVTTESRENFEYGAILKSNSNGTDYALSLDHVNRNDLGYVDYDRIEGIEGILIANTVENFGDKKAKTKKLKTQITHNDGGEWNYLVPPAVDSDGKKYKCTGKSIEACSLNLHGFTERADYRDTFSSSSAIGLMIGIGNVGPYLNKKEEGSTFLTRDGGITWKEIKKGVHMWEYGDRGSILVLVEDGHTDTLSYSLDEGDTWKEYKFSKNKIDVKDLATVPSDNSRKFLIFGESEDDTIGFSVDFSEIYDRQCQLDLDNPDNDDFEYWSPKHPNLADNCLFGHEAKYLRRATGHNDCFIGSAPLLDGFKITRNCSCTRKDYECDYNYYRDRDDTCKLVKGLNPSDHKKEMCKNNQFQYFEPTGYRKIPLSTCEGGKQFDSFIPKPCPGKTKQFNKHYGREVGFFTFILIFGLPFMIFVFVTWFVYDRGIRRNGGFKQFGLIRLDDDEFDFHPIENNQVDKAVNTVVKGGIFVAAALIATAKTVRKFDKVLFEKFTSQFFRGRAGRRNYVNVPNIDDEEEELFGNFRDNYDDELQQGDTENHREFGDDDSNNFDPTESRNIDADARLFDIDDQSDNDSRS